jgi:hypothetical protein
LAYAEVEKPINHDASGQGKKATRQKMGLYAGNPSRSRAFSAATSPELAARVRGAHAI